MSKSNLRLFVSQSPYHPGVKRNPDDPMNGFGGPVPVYVHAMDMRDAVEKFSQRLGSEPRRIRQATGTERNVFLALTNPDQNIL